MYAKSHRVLSCLKFYTLQEWHFISANPYLLLEKMTVNDREVFDFDCRNIDWPSYIETYILGARKYLLKDDMSTVPKARTNLKKY